MTHNYVFDPQPKLTTRCKEIRSRPVHAVLVDKEGENSDRQYCVLTLILAEDELRWSIDREVVLQATRTQLCRLAFYDAETGEELAILWPTPTTYIDMLIIEPLTTIQRITTGDEDGS